MQRKSTEADDNSAEEEHGVSEAKRDESENENGNASSAKVMSEDAFLRDDGNKAVDLDSVSVSASAALADNNNSLPLVSLQQATFRVWACACMNSFARVCLLHWCRGRVGSLGG